jgi:hypothetical protein
MWAASGSIDSGTFELDGDTLVTESDRGEKSKRKYRYELSPGGGFLTLTPGMYNERDEYRKILPQRDLASPVEIEGTWKSIYNSRGPMEETVTFGGGRARIENGNGVFDTEYSLKGNTLRLEYDKDRIVSYVVHIQSCYPDGPDDRILILGEYVSENVTGYPMFYLKVSGKN